MRVYWESMVWSVIADGVVYVKYKNACLEAPMGRMSSVTVCE